MWFDPELDRAPQHRDRTVAVGRDAGPEGDASGQAHRAEADPVDGQVAEVPGGGRRGTVWS